MALDLSSGGRAIAADANLDARRPDIQGLRAVAVLTVMAYHSGLGPDGGYVGVDLFFVISGFVITAMLEREYTRTGTLNLKNFYLRRFKRLVPALTTAVAAVVVASTLLLDPFGIQQLAAQTALGALALCANWVIAAAGLHYFFPTAELNPLLHTWSLSVEEQYYLVFPVLLLVGWRISARLPLRRVGVLALVVAVSAFSLATVLGLAQLIPEASWLRYFYSPVSRAWEFGAGAVLALLAPWVGRVPRWLATPLALSGVALLAIGLVEINEWTTFPGKWTLVPVAAGALLITAGVIAPDNLVSRALSVRPLTLIGDWSYSLYLWHWPVIVFAAILAPQEPAALMVAAVLSIAPALASYYLIEQPIRTSTALVGRKLVAALLAMTLATAGLAGASWVIADRVWVPAFTNGVISPLHPSDPGDEPAIAAGRTIGNACGVPIFAAGLGPNSMCLQSKADAPADIAIVGDSHAAHLFVGLAEELPDKNVAAYAVPALYMMGSHARLKQILDSIVASPSTQTVIISRRWSSYGLRPDTQGDPLAYALNVLTRAGLQVIVTDDVPDFGHGQFGCRYRMAPAIPLASCTVPKAPQVTARAQTLTDLRALVSARPGAVLAGTFGLFCDDSTCRMMDAAQHQLFNDGTHLTATGSRFVARGLLADPTVGPLLRNA